MVNATLWLIAFCCKENPTGTINYRISIWVSGEPRSASANLATIVYYIDFNTKVSSLKSWVTCILPTSYTDIKYSSLCWRILELQRDGLNLLEVHSRKKNYWVSTRTHPLALHKWRWAHVGTNRQTRSRLFSWASRSLHSLISICLLQGAITVNFLRSWSCYFKVMNNLMLSPGPPLVLNIGSLPVPWSWDLPQDWLLLIIYKNAKYKITQKSLAPILPHEIKQWHRDHVFLIFVDLNVVPYWGCHVRLFLDGDLWGRRWHILFDREHSIWSKEGFFK